MANKGTEKKDCIILKKIRDQKKEKRKKEEGRKAVKGVT